MVWSEQTWPCRVTRGGGTGRIAHGCNSVEEVGIEPNVKEERKHFLGNYFNVWKYLEDAGESREVPVSVGWWVTWFTKLILFSHKAQKAPQESINTYFLPIPLTFSYWLLINVKENWKRRRSEGEKETEKIPPTPAETIHQK